jgi:pilus assembly protein Flp/PilA
MLRIIRQFLKCKKGAALVEYSLLVAGVALIGAASVSTFGHKTNDMIAMVAAVLPGAHADDNAPILSGKIIETTATAGPAGGNVGIGLDMDAIVANKATDRLDANMGDNQAVSTLVLEPK